jgi:hypothetical protein
MALLLNQPDNINFLSPLGFRFTLARAPNLNFFATDVNLPSLSLGFIEVPTPFKVLDFPGDRLDYGDLQVTFKVDEDFQNYFEIYNWIVALGFPEDYGQYQRVAAADPGEKENIFSDATLTIMNSGMIPNIEVRFQDLFPVSLGDINFTSTDSDVNYVTNTATFKYKLFTMHKL